MPRWPHRTTFERWADKVLIGDGCWEWTASKYASGYGMFGIVSDDGAWRPIGAHRVAWMMMRGPIPEGLFTCHTCDNPGCVNPAHLFLGPHEANMADMCAKGRSNRGKPQPSKRGENHAQHKLFEREVLAILARLDAGESQQSIADSIGIGQSQVSRIKRGQNWHALTTGRG